MLRKRDDQPYLNEATKNLPGYIEPVYLSPHFDLETQQILDPRHLPELIQEVKFNVRVSTVEKHILVHRLRNQKSLETFDDQDLKNLIEEIQKENKGASKPEFPEIYPFLEEIADKLYLFISREEVQGLTRLGIMGQQLTQLVAKDIQHLYQSMKKKRWHDQQKVKDSIGEQSYLRMQT